MNSNHTGFVGPSLLVRAFRAISKLFGAPAETLSHDVAPQGTSGFGTHGHASPCLNATFNDDFLPEEAGDSVADDDEEDDADFETDEEGNLTPVKTLRTVRSIRY